MQAGIRPIVTRLSRATAAPPHNLAAFILGGGVVVGSLALWLAVPYGCLWLVSKLGENSTGSLEILLVACPIAMVGFGYLLVRINHLYVRAAGTGPRSTRRASGRLPLLEASLTLSAGAAVITLVVWWFMFAHSYLPSTIAP